MNRKSIVAFAALMAFFPLPPALAQGSMDHGSMTKAESGTMADGEVRKVDKDAQKLTIRHGPIPSMDMPPMTMVYRVKDPAMLGHVKQGQKIRFDAEKVGGQYVVTRIEPVQ